MLSHRLFPNARYSIWVDAKSQFRRDPLAVLQALLWSTDKPMAISEHGARSCIYREGEAIVAKHKAGPEEVAVQLNQYRGEGLPENATFDGRKGGGLGGWGVGVGWGGGGEGGENGWGGGVCGGLVKGVEGLETVVGCG